MSLGEEAFDPANLGSCTEVSEERVGDGELLYFRGCATGQACTVVLRGKSKHGYHFYTASVYLNINIMKKK